jgi:hypothetical protein
MPGGPAASGDGFSGPGNKAVAFALTAFAGFGGVRITLLSCQSADRVDPLWL